MKFKELLLKANIDKTMDFFRKHYYSDMEEIKRESQIIGFKNIIKDLIKTEPVDKILKESESTKEDWRICLSWVYYDDEYIKKYPDDKPYVDVHGKSGTLQKESSDFIHFKDNVDEEFANSEITYALELTPWNEWLAMKIEEDTLKEFSYEEILGHCLWEMTFMGWDDESIKKIADDLRERSDWVENCNIDEEIKKGNLISMEDVKEKLEKKFNN